MKYTISAMKARFSEALELVSKGIEVIITDHNRPIAKVTQVARFSELPKVSGKTFLKLQPIKLKAGATNSQEIIRKLRDE